tara:strand:+ start:2814 stop:3167 length:354 start_codon:yes stop_codon:yes gene_type:complete
MKNFSLILALLIVCSFTNIYSQNNDKKKIEFNNITELIDVTYYYNDGTIKQQGSFNTSGLPHGSWTSYDQNGNKLCIGKYKNGKKTGKWYFFNLNKVDSVYFDGGSITSISNEKLSE